MLRLRRAELEAAMAAAAARLAQVEARLRSIESEGHMPADDVVIKSVPAVRVAELTGIAASYEPQDIGPVIGPLYDELFPLPGGGRASGRPVPGSPTTRTPRTASGGAIVVHAGVPVSAPVGPVGGTGSGCVELPAVRAAATIVHRGSMDDVAADRADPGPLDRRQRLPLDRVRPRGQPGVPAGPDQWVTELQEPVAKA